MKKTNLELMDNVFMIHYKNGPPQLNSVSPQPKISSPPNEIVSYQFTGNYYVIFDTVGIHNLYQNINVSKAYKVGSDTMFESDEIVLWFKKSTTTLQKSNLISQYNLTLIKRTGFYERYESNNAAIDAAAIYESGLVDFAHPNFFFRPKPTYIPNDTYFNKQFYLNNTGQIINDGQSGTVDADMDVTEAWDITKGDSNIVVAVLDRGITSNHPDLPNSRQIRLPGGNLSGVFNNTNPNDLSPTLYHGDACAGIVAATQDNAIGISGIAPLSKIMPVKFEAGATPSIIADCIAFADSNNAQILSGSFTYGKNPFPVIESALLKASKNNKLLFFAVGNTRQWLFPQPNPTLGYVEYPANSSIKNVISVGAATINNTLAWYSPISEFVDIVAPSSTTILDNSYSFTSFANSINVWTIDIPTDSIGNNKFPGGDSYVTQGELLPNYGLNYGAFTGRFGGTSAATPMAAGVAALVLSENNCLSNLQIKDILLNTADKVGGFNYNWSSIKPGHSKEFGYGRINAHKAVLAAQAIHSDSLDLMIKDVPNDFGIEPDTIARYLYVSEDIWIRNQQDGLQNQFHENPVYNPSNPVYVYVKVRNKSCTDATVNDSVKLYWAKAATSLNWPDYWDGSINSPALMGSPLGTKSIGNLQAGKDTILQFTWNLPNPNNYKNINPQPWHFCLLGRIVSNKDPMTVTEGNTLWKNVKNNNNIAWKNINVIRKDSITQIEPQLGLGAVIAIGNDAFNQSKPINITFQEGETTNFGNLLQVDAEITIVLDELAIQKWEDGGSQMEGMEFIGNNTFKIIDPYASIKNLSFNEGEIATLYLGLNFLTEEVGEKVVYKYQVEQYNANSGEFIGGEQYLIHRDERDLFLADAGEDEVVNLGNTIELKAESIGENAIYNWYDESGKLFYKGIDTVFAPSKNQKFKLEVIANKDGFKDYDEKTITIKENYIESVSPNPVNSTQKLTVNYYINQTAVVKFKLFNTLTNKQSTYTASSTTNSIKINLNSLSTGSYILSMLVNNVVVDTKKITIN